MMPDLNQLFFIAFVSAALAFILAIGIGIFPAEQIWLGDEVTTTDRYTELFNDSFSGRVVSNDGGMYTVRDETGEEREIERHWLVKCGKSTGVLTHMIEELRPNSTSKTPNTVLYMNASAAMGMATKDEQGTPMIWVDNTSGIVWIMVSNGHQVPANVTDIENIETTYSYIDIFEYVDQTWTEKRETEEI